MRRITIIDGLVFVNGRPRENKMGGESKQWPGLVVRYDPGFNVFCGGGRHSSFDHDLLLHDDKGELRQHGLTLASATVIPSPRQIRAQRLDQSNLVAAGFFKVVTGTVCRLPFTVDKVFYRITLGNITEF